MNKTRLRRSLVAVVTTVACLVAFAGPASAAYNASVTGGVLHVYKNSVVLKTIALGGTTTCPQAPAIVADVSTGTTANITSFTSRSIENFGGGTSTDPFLVILTRIGSLAGAYNSTVFPHTVTSARLTINAAMYPHSNYNATTCTPTGAATCNLAAQLHLTGTTTSTSTSNTYSLDVTTIGTIVGNPSCPTGPSSYIGGTIISSSSITGHFTSVV